MTSIATADDLALSLDIQNINLERAQWLLDRAQEKCETYLTPLPATALSIVCDVAGRAYRAPSPPQSDGADAYYPTTGMPGGLFLTQANIAELRRLATADGSGGAFTIDPTPADAGPYNYWAQVPLSPEDYWATYPYGFDVIPT